MKQWLIDRPWVWIVMFFAVLIGASIWTVIVAHINRPTVL